MLVATCAMSSLTWFRGIPRESWRKSMGRVVVNSGKGLHLISANHGSLSSCAATTGTPMAVGRGVFVFWCPHACGCIGEGSGIGCAVVAFFSCFFSRSPVCTAPGLKRM